MSRRTPKWSSAPGNGRLNELRDPSISPHARQHRDNVETLAIADKLARLVWKLPLRALKKPIKDVILAAAQSYLNGAPAAQTLNRVKEDARSRNV